MKFLRPDLHIERLTEVDFAPWCKIGIRCVFVDLDNTISPWRQTRITEDASTMIAKAREAGLIVALFTNAPEERAQEAAWNAGIGYYARAMKPLPFMIKKAMAELSVKPRETMIIGDQVFTDVLAGKLAGCRTVLTSPLSAREFSGTKVLRFLERFIVGRKLVFQENPNR